MLLLWPLIRWYRRRAAVEVGIFFKTYEVWSSVFEELTDGAPTARRFGRTDIAGRFDEPNITEAVAFANTQITLGRLIAGIALLRGGTIALILLIAPQLTAGATQLAVIAGFVAALPGLFGPLTDLARKLGYVQLGVVALDTLGLRSWVEGLPEGISTVVDGHRHISDGERQLIALAQVVLLNPSVVLLDEPTSALDPATARTLEQATTRALAGRTIVLITHRLPSAATCNEIIVLEGGKVSEHLLRRHRSGPSSSGSVGHSVSTETIMPPGRSNIRQFRARAGSHAVSTAKSDTMTSTGASSA